VPFRSHRRARARRRRAIAPRSGRRGIRVTGIGRDQLGSIVLFEFFYEFIVEFEFDRIPARRVLVTGLPAQRID